VHNDLVLLAQNRKKHHLFLPGGHIEFAESARTALAREMKEELGIIISVGQFLGAVEHRWRGRKRTHAEINLLFQMRCPLLDSSRIPTSREEKIGFAWHALSDLSSINFQPDILRTILPDWVKYTRPGGWASTIE